MVKIAGRTVNIGDRLYSAEHKVWGTVVRFDASGPAIAEFPAKPRGKRVVYVQNGGIVNGIRSIYWHPPLHVDVPVGNLAELQAMVDALVTFKYGRGK